jgi:hypothetical protein
MERLDVRCRVASTFDLKIRGVGFKASAVDLDRNISLYEIYSEGAQPLPREYDAN